MSEWLERMRVTPGRVSVCPRDLPRIPSGKGVGQADLGPSSEPKRGRWWWRGESRRQELLPAFLLLSAGPPGPVCGHQRPPSLPPTGSLPPPGFRSCTCPPTSRFLHHMPPSLPGLSHTPSNGSHVGINLPILDPIWLPHRVSVPLGAELFEGGVRYPVSASSHSFRLFSSQAHQKFSYQGHDDPGCQIQGLFSRLTP